MHAQAEYPPSAPRGRTSFEVADVVRLCGEAFARAHLLDFEERRVLRDIEVCRTAMLGGHLDVCQACGDSRPSYNSCRNRHCPKCQALRQARWIAEREHRVLPTHHFHVVFTLPAELRAVCRRYRTIMFDMLFACAADTLLELGRDPERLGGQLAITAVLHTWKRDLGWHPHLHCIVSGGALDVCRDRWVSTSRRFLFPVLVMGELFRGKMLARLRRALEQGTIAIRDADLDAFFSKLYATKWVVYAKRPFRGAEQVIRYLGRYTHRVAISNGRIEDVSSEGVRFQTKDGRRVTLAPDEFLRRFLLHVLPHGFTKIRHYGLMAASNVNGRLQQARALLTATTSPTGAAAPPPTAALTWDQLLMALLGMDPFVCPHCRARTVVRLPLPSTAPTPTDTS